MTDPSKAVTEMLSTAVNPLVAISVLPKLAIQSMRMEFHRSVGFISERFRGNWRLVTTCRHAFLGFDKRFEYIFTAKNPEPTRLRIVGEPIFDSKSESDIAFAVVRDPQNAPTRPLAITADDVSLRERRTLYNAANKTDMSSSICEFLVTRQQVVERDVWAFVKLSSPTVNCIPRDDEAQERALLEDGWIRCWSLNMMSRKGFSGSPIWDDDLHVYGMDVRGSDPGSDNYDEQGDVTICVPSSEIHRARQRMDYQIQKILSGG